MPGIVREGTNLFSNISIDYTDAILGTVAQVSLRSTLYSELARVIAMERTL